MGKFDSWIDGAERIFLGCDNVEGDKGALESKQNQLRSLAVDLKDAGSKRLSTLMEAGAASTLFQFHFISSNTYLLCYAAIQRRN